MTKSVELPHNKCMLKNPSHENISNHSTVGVEDQDPGSLLQQRLELVEHLKQNRKDYHTQRALIKLVGKRRKLLDYLKAKDITRYREIVSKLGLRR